MRAILDFYLNFNLALMMWAEEALSWPLVLLGGNLNGDIHRPRLLPDAASDSDSLPPVARDGVLYAELTRGDETGEAFVGRTEAVAANWFSSD